MEYRQLGNTDLKVSAICLGTMTWLEQNTEQQAPAQLDYALSGGINVIDTAEIHPVPPKLEFYDATEIVIGHSDASSFNRDGQRERKSSIDIRPMKKNDRRDQS